MKIIETNISAGNTIRDVLEKILARDLCQFKNIKILEIGCGNWDYAKKILEKNGCKWYGFDVLDNKLSPIKGSISSIPFHNNYFDLIIGNQTIEHWFEYGVKFKTALNEINRVLKENGTLILNAPIHVHGHPIFLRGNITKIIRLFNKEIWKIKRVEKCFPKIKVKGWKKLGNSGWQSKIGYPDYLIPNNKDAFSYILNIHFTKLGTYKKLKNNNGSYMKEIKTILRFLKELL